MTYLKAQSWHQLKDETLKKMRLHHIGTLHTFESEMITWGCLTCSQTSMEIKDESRSGFSIKLTIKHKTMGVVYLLN